MIILIDFDGRFLILSFAPKAFSTFFYNPYEPNPLNTFFQKWSVFDLRSINKDKTQTKIPTKIYFLSQKILNQNKSALFTKNHSYYERYNPNIKKNSLQRKNFSQFFLVIRELEIQNYSQTRIHMCISKKSTRQMPHEA
jgi:hypothetical protein